MNIFIKIDGVNYKVAQNSVSDIFYIIQLNDDNKCYKGIGKIKWDGYTMQALKSNVKELLKRV